MASVQKSSVTIANGASLSSAVAFQENVLTAVVTPTGMEGAAIRFLGSADSGVSFLPVRDEVNIAVSVTIDTDPAYRLLDANLLLGLTHIKLQTVDGAGAAVNQVGEAEVVLIFRPYP